MSLSYKTKSLLYFLAFLASAMIYYIVDSDMPEQHPTENLQMASETGNPDMETVQAHLPLE